MAQDQATDGRRGRLTARRKTARPEPELEILNRLGLALAGQLDPARLVRAVTDAGVAITGAAFGVFSGRDGSDAGAQYFSGTLPKAFGELPPFHDAADAFGSPMPPGTRPSRSCLAAPVRSGVGELHGRLFFGHPDPAFFHDRDARLVTGLAAHAGIALDNAHLYREAQEARAAAETATGLKDELLATLSHELRTPLTTIVGWAHMLRRGQLSPEATTRALDTIIRSASAQNLLIDELLDVSQIITGKLQLELRPVEITGLVEAALGTVAPAAGAKGIRLLLIQDSAGSRVMGNPERLQQVFWNLFSNAIKFTSNDGHVRVRVRSVERDVEVVVADSGMGIEAGFLPRLFDRFTQNDSSSARPAGGLGLGLSIARQLVELHGGSIQAASPGLGQGSTFTTRLPRSRGEQPSRRRGTKVAPSSRRGGVPAAKVSRRAQGARRPTRLGRNGKAKQRTRKRKSSE